jgi:hypothetical protein
MGYGIQLMLLAGVLVAASNYFMRRSIDAGGSSKAFLMIQLSITFVVAILLNPVRAGDFTWSHSMGIFGFLSGLILAFMMICLGKAVESGPSALTFSMLNCSTVMPILCMVAFFGSGFGFIYNAYNAFGSLLVVIGLLWAGWETFKIGNLYKWLTFALGAFFLHIVFLVIMQWRALFIHFPSDRGLLLSFDEMTAQSQWFMPMVFLAAALVQWFVYLSAEKRKPLPAEMKNGVMGGIANGAGTFLMIRSTEVATSFEQAMIFPLFSVSTIIVCNLWGQWIYKERINWKASAFCVAGVLLGTVNWPSIFSK